MSTSSCRSQGAGVEAPEIAKIRQSLTGRSSIPYLTLPGPCKKHDNSMIGCAMHIRSSAARPTTSAAVSIVGRPRMRGICSCARYTVFDGVDWGFGGSRIALAQQKDRFFEARKAMEGKSACVSDVGGHAARYRTFDGLSTSIIHIPRAHRAPVVRRHSRFYSVYTDLLHRLSIRNDG